MFEVLVAIAGSVLVGIGGLLIGLCVKFRSDWEYMKKLRSSIPSSKENCECYMVCGLFKIFLGYFLCHCCCCKVEEPEVSMMANCIDISDGEDLEDSEVWKVWSDFVENETIPITQDDLSYMKQKYINYEYSHKNYCFKKTGERCNRRQCYHHGTIDWKRLIQHPVLYLIELNFDKAIEKCAQMNVTNLKLKDGLHWHFETKMYFEFVFKAALEPKFLENQDYKNIEESLGEKINNICLVIQDFPRECQHENKHKEQIYLLRAIMSLRKNWNVPLIYNVR